MTYTDGNDSKRSFPAVLKNGLVRLNSISGYEAVSDFYYADTVNIRIASYAKCSLDGDGVVMAWGEDSDGYIAAKVRKTGGGKTDIRRNRLTLTVHGILPPGPGYHAHHRNSIRTDDRLENLEWVHESEHPKDGGTPNRLGPVRAAMAQHELRYKNSMFSNKELAKKAGTTARIIRDAANKRTYADVAPIPDPHGDEVLIMNFNDGTYDCSVPDMEPGIASYRRKLERQRKARND